MTEQKTDNLYSGGCLIIITTRFWGATKKIDQDQLGDLPKEIVRASRDLLLRTDKIEAVRGILGEAKRFVKSNTMDFPIPSVDFISKNRISFVDEGLQSRKEWAEGALEDVIDALEQLKAEYQAKYPDMYSEANYPTPIQLRDNFTFEWKFRTISPPGKELGILTPEIYDRARASFDHDMKEFQDGLISAVAKDFYDRIDKLKAQCFGGDISASTVKSINKVLEKFDTVYDGCIAHEGLKEMIDDVKLYMGGTDANMLKADDGLRSMVGKKMKEVTSLIVNSKDKRLTRRLDIA